MTSGNTWSFYPSQSQKDADLRAELGRLRAENQSLIEELAQTQSDKEFVWSLWKRLQVASPDITQAVGMVVEREKEKAELKDRKVLEILQLKDSKIDELQRTASEQAREISSILARKSELQDDNRQMKDEVELLRNKVNNLESSTRSREELHDQRLQGLQQDRKDLESQNKELEEELFRLRRENERLESSQNSDAAKVKTLEEDLHEVGVTYDKIVKEHDEAKLLLQRYEKELSQHKTDIEHKNKELESVRRELSELWETHQQTAEQASQQVELITQLQELQRDTHQMMKNHEDAFSLENASMKNMQDELQMQCNSLKAREEQLIQKCTEQEQVIMELEKEIEDIKLHNKSIGTQASFADSEDKAVQGPGAHVDTEYQVDSLSAEVKALRTKLREKNRVIQRLGAMDDDMTFASDIQPLSSTPKKGQARRARSLSPGRLKRISKTSKDPKSKLPDPNTMLKLKTAELNELRAAHDKRLERLRALQQEYRLLKKQHKTLEEELDSKPKKKKITRADPKSLRKEDTDTVWNELAYFKKEHKKLIIEKMNLEEEVDLLRVQTKQDAASIYELKACLEHEREETKLLLEQARRPASPKPDPQLQQLAYRLKHSEAENEKLSEDCQQLLQEQEERLQQIRSLKTEVAESKQKVAEKRIEITDLKREVHRLQRELKRRKKRGPMSALGRQYQKVLNKSITEMKQAFGEFVDKEGWEDVEDSEPIDSTEVVDTTSTCNTSGTAGTGGSLGQDIVRSARQTAGVSSPAKHSNRQADSVDSHVLRLKQKKEELKSRAEKISAVKVQKPGIPLVRHMATSPVHFEAEEAGGERKTGGLVPAARSRQLSTLRQRISSLQQQVRILKTCKSTNMKTISMQKVQVETLQADLSLANQRLQSTRLMLQRLSAEVEREKEAKESLERQLDETQTTESLSTTAEAAFRKTEEEWNSLQARLRISTTEVTKQLTAIRELKAEKNNLEDKISQQQERISHLERDLNQKRSLLEDQKVKLKIAQQSSSVDTAAMEELESKVRTLTDTNTRQKTQLESMKQRLQAVSKEKHNQEEHTIKLTQELDRKMKQMSELQKKCGELQRSLAEVEETAWQQLHGLAGQSEAAIDAAQGKLAMATSQLDQFHKFVKTLAHELLSSVQQLRQLVRQRQQSTRKSTEKKPEVSMARAQDMAKEILNLSQSDLEDIMFGADDRQNLFSASEEELRKDKKWSHRCAKLLTSKECFAIDLVDLLMQKVEEKCSLTSKLGVT